jgi:hypothetical protein
LEGVQFSVDLTEGVPMSLQDDVLCVLSPIAKKTGNAALIETMKHSRFCVTAPRFLDVLNDLVERGFARTYTEEGRRDGVYARERILCTPPLYLQYELTRTGNDKRKLLMSRRRVAELKMMRRRT